MSRYRYADPQGRCIHPQRPDETFCHRPLHKQRPGLCHRPSGWGTGHHTIGACKLHGGALDNNERVGQMELARRRAEAVLADLNTEPVPVDNPLAALASLAGEAVRWKDILAAHVAELTGLRHVIADEDGHRKEMIRGEVLLFQTALRDLGTLLVAIGRLNIDDRLARIDERMADIVVRAVEAGLVTAGVRPESMATVSAVVGREIRRRSA